MFAASAGFTAFHGLRFLVDASKQMKRRAEFDFSQFLRYAWNAVFWLGGSLRWGACCLGPGLGWCGVCICDGVK